MSVSSVTEMGVLLGDGGIIFFEVSGGEIFNIEFKQKIKPILEMTVNIIDFDCNQQDIKTLSRRFGLFWFA